MIQNNKKSYFDGKTEFRCVLSASPLKTLDFEPHFCNKISW